MEKAKKTPAVPVAEEMSVQTETFQNLLEKVEISTYLCNTCTLEYLRKLKQTAEKKNKPKRTRK